MKKEPRDKKHAKTAACSTSSQKNESDEDEFKPRPAFRAFELEKDWVGKNLLRSMAMLIYGGNDAENGYGDPDELYMHAIGKVSPWTYTHDSDGQVVKKEKRLLIPPVEAAEELIKLALDAATYVELLRSKEPDLCRQVAIRLPHWPIKADLTTKDWKREGDKVITDVGLGRGIEGFLKSARTSDENPIRLFATAIYETLHQTRFDLKRVDENIYMTAEGCPAWAKHTLDLPRFSKADASSWMKIGREMLLEQRPDFLDDPLLQQQRFKWERRAVNRSRSGNVTLRAIQNEAFDDFSKEMKKLAPTKNVFRGKW